MNATTRRMPTAREFNDAGRRLVAAGWILSCTLMADDAHKDGVTNFGRLYVKEGREFWLNFKTLANLPV